MSKLNEFLKNNSILIIVIALLGLFLHGKLPYMLPLSVMISMVLLIVVMIVEPFKNHIKNKFFEFVKLTWSYLLIVFFYILAAFVYYDTIFIVNKEVVYALYIWFLLFFLYVFIKDQKGVKFISTFSIGYILLNAILAVIFFINLYTTGNWYEGLFDIGTDENFLSLTFIIGFLIVLWISNNYYKINYIFFQSFLLLIFVVPVIVVGSRRGVILIIVIHIILIFYSLIKSIVNRKIATNYSVYLSIVFFLLAAILFILSINSSAWRLYVVDNYFNTKSESIKQLYTKSKLTYKSIYNETPTYNEQFNKDWRPKLFSAHGVFDKKILNNEISKLNKYIEEEQFNEAFSSIKKLRYFCKSFNHFKSVVPWQYSSILDKKLLNDSILAFENLPYYFPIPHIENDIFSNINIKNLYLTQDPSITNFFQFIIDDTLKIGNEQISSEILLMSNSQSSIKFSIEKKYLNKLSVSLIHINSKINIDYIESDSLLCNNKIQKTFYLNTDGIESGIYRFIISPEIQIKDTLTIGPVEYKRLPKIDTKLDLFDYSLVNNYLKSYNKRKNDYKELYVRYLTKSYKLLPEQEDSLFMYLTQYNSVFQKFRPYGYSTKILGNTESTWLFSRKNNEMNSGAYILVPTMVSGTYQLSMTVKAKKTPYFYVKRFPEEFPHYLDNKVNRSSLIKIDSTTYQLVYNYSPISSLSGIGTFIIGFSNTSIGDMFEISQANFKIIELKDSSVSRYQYNYIKLLMQQPVNMGNAIVDSVKNQIYLSYKDSLSIGKNIFKSRLERWKFAWFYFKQQPLNKKIFGSGFKYLKIYPLVFELPDVKIKYDYPHNPIISAFLYSGIVGGLIYIFFLVLTFYKYWIIRRRMALLGLLYLVTFSYVFFSGNSHFSVPAFIILSLMPFVFDENENDSDTNASKL